MQQPSAQGIASLFRGNPAPLQQRIQQEQQAKPGLPPDLQKLLALNIVTNEQDAVAKQQAMDQLAQMQGPQGQQSQPPTVMQAVQEQARQKMQAQAVQAQQQQQGLQALMQQAQSPQVPENTPQPEAQPQGIDELPVEFQMASGGIVAFQEGRQVPRIQDEQTISDEERARLERELLMRIIGEEARNPPVRREPMRITESDLTSVPGMEKSDLMARALADARGPQPDNRAMLNAINVRDARRSEEMDREREKAASRPKYETPYDRMNRQNRGDLTNDERQVQAAREAQISQIPTGGDPTVAGGERVRGSEVERNILNTLASLPGAGASRATTTGRQALAGIAGLLGMDKSNAPEGRAEPQVAPSRAAAAPSADFSSEARMTSQRPGDIFVPRRQPEKPVADLMALAEQQRRQQQPRPARLAPAVEPVSEQAPVTAPSAAIAPPQSEANRILNERMMQDPMVAAANKEMMYRSRVGDPDTTQRDAMIRQLQEERARQVGPQDSFGQLMEYLGQVAATPRGLSSFEAGAAGARGVRGLEEQRAQKRFDLGSKIIEQEQGKIEASRQYAKDVYGVGEREYDQIFKAQYEAAKQVSANETEARKMAQQEALKVLELQQQATLDREKMKNQVTVAGMQQLGERNEQARIDKITSLKQQARRATDPKVAAELMAQASDLEALVSRGSAASALIPKAMTRDQASDNVAKKLEITNPNRKQVVADATQALRAAGIANPSFAQIEEHLIQEQMRGVSLSSSGAAPAQTGKVPPPPPGFKLN
jgi:hypothetical protein